MSINHLPHHNPLSRINLSYWCPTNNAFWCGEYWNPLTDDGDALRLAVKLRMNVFHAGARVHAMDEDGDIESAEGHEKDPCAATRRAIVRVAAEIGEDI